jgi:hypothetical protein
VVEDTSQGGEVVIRLPVSAASGAAIA